ncbi:MAG: glycosyltransferase [Gemmataceae bacterium]
MRLTALVDSPDHVCCRYRLRAFASAWAAAGYTLELLPRPASWWDWCRFLRRRFDTLIIQRRLFSPWQLTLLRRRCRFLIFDFDDAVFLRDSYSRKAFASSRRVRWFRAMMQAADAVVAGNDFLRDHAARWTHPERVRVIPTCVEVRNYPLARHDNRVAVQLAWIGSSSTLQGLEAVRPLWEAIGQQLPQLRLKLICDRIMRLDHLPILFCPWSEATEATELATCDIGISWVPDDPWSRGKCALKVVQYLAAGLPVVVNPVGVQADLVGSAPIGFAAQTTEQWIAALGRLAQEPALRRQQGRTGRQLVEHDYSVTVGAARWLQLLDCLHARARGA